MRGTDGRARGEYRIGRRVQSLCRAPETRVTPCVSCTAVKKKDGQSLPPAVRPLFCWRAF